MLAGRFLLIIPSLAIAVIVTGLTYFPVVALGPLPEHCAGHF